MKRALLACCLVLAGCAYFDVNKVDTLFRPDPPRQVDGVLLETIRKHYPCWKIDKVYLHDQYAHISLVKPFERKEIMYTKEGKVWRKIG